MKTKTIIVIMLLCVALSMGCTDQPVDTPASVSVEEPEYNNIWYSVTINMYVYDYNDNYIGYETITETNTIPYTDFDWYGNIDLEDYLKDAHGIIDVGTVKDETSYPADNKVLSTFKVILYGEDGYIIMDGYSTGTRY